MTFGNIHGTDRAVEGVSTIKEDSITFCAVDENIFAVPSGYRRQGKSFGLLLPFPIRLRFSSPGEGEGYHPMMYMDDDALLQMTIERSLRDENGANPTNEESLSSDQVTLYEALGHPGARGIRSDYNDRYVDYDLQR